MRILTYPDPHEINKNVELWEMVTTYPHFCSSDTLRQGLIAKYGRSSFQYLETVENLKTQLIRGFSSSVEDDIKLFIFTSAEIRKIKDEKLKKSFRFNISQVVEAIKFLAYSNLDVYSFDQSILNEQQKILLDIFISAKENKCFSLIENFSKLDKTEIVSRIKDTILKSITFEIKKIKYLKLESKGRFSEITEAVVYLEKIVDLIANQLQEPETFGNPSYKEFDLENFKMLLAILRNVDNLKFDKVIIHGIHNFTMDTIFTLKELESKGIEVVFLINYIENLPKLYSTWKNVYSWTDNDFEYSSKINLGNGNEVGKAIAEIIEGTRKTDLQCKITAFDNLTSFTDHKIKKLFEKAQKEHKVFPLNYMKTQFYAVKNNSSNELLKTYFPDQFEYKPFLSYPIGQFILSIYSMWDFDKQGVIISEKNLKECAVSRVFNDTGVNILNVIDRVKLYFSDIEKIEEYLERLALLENTIRKIQLEKIADLEYISFFNISSNEIETFRKFLEFINETSRRLFIGSSKDVSFSDHFSKLLNVLQSHGISQNLTSDVERNLVNDLASKLNTNTVNITGQIDDVKEALFYYLNTKKEEDSSNWIVRGFEQLDGAVLLKTKATSYHYGLLSNNNMTKFNKDIIPWPITLEMFDRYRETKAYLSIVSTSIREHKNFLRYSLFYGSFFYKGNIEFSYIKEEDNCQQEPYYLFNVLGFKEESFIYSNRNSFQVPSLENGDSGNKIDVNKIRKDSKEMFAICPFKFFNHEILKEPIEYTSEFHIKYYFSNFIYFQLNKDKINKKNIDDEVTKMVKKFKPFFPFWSQLEFSDIEDEITSKCKKEIEFKNHINNTNPDYVRRKRNFLIAKWNSAMNFDIEEIDSKIEEYLLYHGLFSEDGNSPDSKVCENCNYYDICLRDYYEALSNEN